MDDRRLLELAAKAAGYEVKRWEVTADSLARRDGVSRWTTWNPLTDDGDALRLAVRLRMMVDADGETYSASTANPRGTGVMAHEKHRGDPYAATRRAIVRAAAAIGQAKEQK